MKRTIALRRCVVFLILCSLVCTHAPAQFLDDFNGTFIVKDPNAINGWAFFTGDGLATMDFQPRSTSGDGYASISVDATKDKRNIWWALIKRCVSERLDLSRKNSGLNKPGYELRIEARIRTSHAPRRVNLHLNTQRTVDFHTHLMEFDPEENSGQQTGILFSMTTKDFDAQPGDRVFGQLVLMDWGLGKYRVDVDYMKVDIVNAALAGPDKGVQVPYHPPIPDPNSFTH